MEYIYLLTLLFSLAGIAYADYRFKLFLFRSRRQALAVWLAALPFFLAWDIAGIRSGIFGTNQDRVTGLYLGSPDMPIEELFFLTLLIYVTALVWRLVCIRIS